MTVEEKIKAYMGDLLLANLQLSTQVEGLSAEVAQLRTENVQLKMEASKSEPKEQGHDMG